MDDLDDILDSALDDFRKVVISNPAEKSSSRRDSDAADRSADVQNDAAVPSVSGEFSRATLGQGLGLGLPGLAGGKKKSARAKGSSSSSSSSGMMRAGALDKGLGMDSDVAPPRPLSTVEKLAQQTRETVGNMDAIENDNLLGDELVENLMKQFEDLGGTQDMQSIMDTMMRQLLSKEVLHEPMKEIGERYPQWLDANKSQINQEDYDRYSKQQQYILQLCDVYEKTPDDFQKIMDLMQNMQNCGQPPSDIVKELAPGLDLDQEGMPVLPDFSALGPGGQPNCSIM